VITIEDPIEFVHEPAKAAITHREVGTHTESFAAGLRAALRESPDVLALGEMRDLETYSWRCRRPRPACWCWARCTPTPRPRRWTASWT
jgi:Tfp pilus assembly ATPase PilU